MENIRIYKLSTFFILLLSLFNCCIDKRIPKKNKFSGMCTEAFASWGIKATECTKCFNRHNYVSLYFNFPMPPNTLGLTFIGRNREIRIMMKDNSDNSYGLMSGIKHEVGHVLGLGHSPDKNDLMYFAPNTFTVKEPSPADYLLAQSFNLGREFNCEIFDFYQRY